MKKVRTVGFWLIIGVNRGQGKRFCTVSAAAAVLTEANPAIPLYRYRRTIVLLLGNGEEGPRALAGLDRFKVKYAAYF